MTATMPETKPKCSLTREELADVRKVHEMFGAWTVRDADPTFTFSFGPWVRAEQAHKVGEKFHPAKGRQGAWDEKISPDQNRMFEREYLTMGEGSTLFPDGVKLGTFKVWSRHVGGVDKWDFVDRIYDITADEKKRLLRLMNGQRHVTRDEMLAIEKKNEQARVRAAEMARDPDGQARIVADRIGDKLAEALAKLAPQGVQTSAPESTAEEPASPRRRRAVPTVDETPVPTVKA